MSETMQTVLITGCSSGIGRATALLLAENGFRVLAGVRSAEQVELLSSLSLSGLEPILLDVTNEDNVRSVVEYAEQTCPQGLYGLVNNAGMGLPAAVELSTIDEVRQLLEVNTVGPLRMIQGCLPLLRAGRGRVINMSSMNGTLAMPMVGAYSASKFALEALSDTLQRGAQTLADSGSHYPPRSGANLDLFQDARRLERPQSRHTGRTEGGLRRHVRPRRGVQRAGGPIVDFARDGGASREAGARKLKRPRTHYLVGIDAQGMQLAKSLVPRRLLDRAFARVMRVLKPVNGLPSPTVE